MDFGTLPGSGADKVFWRMLQEADETTWT